MLSLKRFHVFFGLAITLGLLAGAASVAAAQEPLPFANPIVPGDHPDPTILRTGDTYWTSSTSGNWAPVFPLYKSTDLRHWTAVGSIFPHPPSWAEGDFWAPELVSDSGRVVVYYVGRKRGGPLCVAAATAATPAGPYVDQGPIVCQEDGSLDPAFVRDEGGKPYLIWKEDGNSRNQPTYIWAQPLTSDLLHLTGEKTSIFVNQAASWEGGVVEAPYILKHGGMFYLFYAGNACCGVTCHYAEGVARAEHLLGPWTRDPANPIIRANDVWRCPGHGTAVESPSGKDYFLYHAYPIQGNVYLGRESILDPIAWSKDAWPVVNGGLGPGMTPRTGDGDHNFGDTFTDGALNPEWKWPVGHEPRFEIKDRTLTLFAPETQGQAYIARSLLTAAYQASVAVMPEAEAAGGIGLIGDTKDHVVLSRTASSLQLWETAPDGQHTLWTQKVDSGAKIWLRVVSTDKGTAKFSYRDDSGDWRSAGEEVNLEKLLPWDSGLRVGLLVQGAHAERARFTDFKVSGMDTMAGATAARAAK